MSDIILRDVAIRIKNIWSKAEFVGPKLDTPIICCLCAKEFKGNCGVPDFRELCNEFKDAGDLFREEYAKIIIIDDEQLEEISEMAFREEAAKMWQQKENEDLAYEGEF